MEAEKALDIKHTGLCIQFGGVEHSHSFHIIAKLWSVNEIANASHLLELHQKAAALWARKGARPEVGEHSEQVLRIIIQ